MKKETYLVGHKKCGVKVGDKVKVKRKAKDWEAGWGNSWMKEMDIAVGEIGEVISDYGTSGFTLHFSKEKIKDLDPSFPFFVLEKVEKEGGEKMKPRVFWVTRDKSKTCNVFFWTKKPSLSDVGQWWGKGRYTEPDFILDPSETARIFGVKVKVGEIKECKLEIIT